VNIGDKVRLDSPGVWTSMRCDIQPVYTVTGVKPSTRKDPFGSGLGVTVTPALQSNHPLGDGVWYDSTHFVALEPSSHPTRERIGA
jgi:hypothetical protein